MVIGILSKNVRLFAQRMWCISLKRMVISSLFTIANLVKLCLLAEFDETQMAIWKGQNNNTHVLQCPEAHYASLSDANWYFEFSNLQEYLFYLVYFLDVTYLGLRFVREWYKVRWHLYKSLFLKKATHILTLCPKYPPYCEGIESYRFTKIASWFQDEVYKHF